MKVKKIAKYLESLHFFLQSGKHNFGEGVSPSFFWNEMAKYWAVCK